MTALLCGSFQTHLRTSMPSGGGHIIKADLDGKLTFMNEGGLRAMDVSDFNEIAGCSWPGFWQDQANALAWAAVAGARKGETHSFVEQAETFSGTRKWWHVAVSPIAARDGSPERILAVSRDITDLKSTQENLQFMNEELAHRLKNVLAVAQSVVQQSLRSSSDTGTAARDIASRLMALGAATDILTRSSWRSAELGEVVRCAVAPHVTPDTRIITEGPAITLRAEVTVAFALTLHELATNAVKYGALSNDLGTVTISWYVEGEGDDAVFILTWEERGGPRVSPPTRKGFGSVLIERSLQAYLGGKAATEYRPGGLVFTLRGQLKHTCVTEN